MTRVSADDDRVVELDDERLENIRDDQDAEPAAADDDRLRDDRPPHWG
jgi:hypothetical protein